jgi:hypothetical protein
MALSRWRVFIKEVLMIKLFFTFLLGLFTIPAFGGGLKNEALQKTIQTALSVTYPAGDTDLRLCTYGECTIIALGDALSLTPRSWHDSTDAEEVSLILTTIFSSAGALLKPESRVKVNLQRYMHECDNDCFERKTIDADVTLGGMGCQ